MRSTFLGGTRELSKPLAVFKRSRSWKVNSSCFRWPRLGARKPARTNERTRAPGRSRIFATSPVVKNFIALWNGLPLGFIGIRGLGANRGFLFLYGFLSPAFL